MEKIKHPDHYGGDTVYEAIKVIKAWGHHKSFCIGNALKYLCRMGKKANETPMLDLEKAINYLNIELEFMKQDREIIKKFIEED